MADQKSAYSEASRHYIEIIVPISADDKNRFDRAKAREAKYNEKWKAQTVNINEIVDEFCPDFIVKQKGNKFIFKGDRFDVSADMVGGYLTIYDNQINEWIKIDGTVAENGNGHYKIKKREEM